MSQVLHRTPDRNTEGWMGGFEKTVGTSGGHKISFAVRKGRGRLYPVKKKDLQGKQLRA